MTTRPAEILKKANQIKSDLVAYRRHVHANPELSFEETQTANFVAAKLREFGLSPATGVGGTGVTVDIGKGEVIAVRCDMDALPIEETNEFEYKSKNPGVMHACGHDVHTACGLGVASLLAKSPPKNGCIRIVFQPAEEATNSDGASGATMMLREGVFKDAKSVIAVHVEPDIPTGTIALRSGPLLAACDSFDITIHGKGSHGAYPQFGIDPVIIASQIIQTIQTVISRRKSALEPVVITLGGIKSSTFRPNIISDSVEITGTVRYFSLETRDVLKNELEKACRIAETMGGSYSLSYYTESPAVINDKQIVATVDGVAREMLGRDSISEATMQMGADDFGFLSEALPCTYIYLGAKIHGQRQILHTSTYETNEDALPIGTAILTASALALLDQLQ